MDSPPLPLDDPRWAEFEGGYRLPYNASPVLRRLLGGHDVEPIYAELWQELHHQGDVGVASYAAVPHLCEFLRRSARLEWQPLAMIVVIELERTAGRNPPVPELLAQAYFGAIRGLPELLAGHPDRAWSEHAMPAAAACIALARGQRQFARAYLDGELSELRRWIATEHGLHEGSKADRQVLDSFFSQK